jgi:membrane fusion protein (multidrug efflux system)
MNASQNPVPDVAPKNYLQRKNLLIGLGVLFLLIGLITLCYWLLIGQFYEKTDDAYVSGNLVQVMPQISGYITSIYADETNYVRKGDMLVKLEKADTEIELEKVKAELALTVRRVAQLYANVEQLRSNVKIQQDNLEKTQQDYTRRGGLVVNKVISQESLDHVRIALNTARDNVSLAKSQLAAAVALVENSDLYHHPQTIQAAANLRTAYLSWQRTTIYAPVTGYVAKRTVQVGQQVHPNTVLMVIVPLNEIWVDANFKESQLADIQIGQPVKLISDFYGNKVTYHGCVMGLSPGAGSTFDLLPAQNATGNWIKIIQRLPVRISLDPEQLNKKPLRLGLSMTVTVDTHQRNHQTLSQTPQTAVLYQTKDESSDLEKANQLIDEIIKANAKNINYSDLP